MERRADQETAQSDWGDWIALRLVRGVGNVTYRQLLDRFTSPREILRTSPAMLTEAGISARIAQAIVAFDQWKEVEAEVEQLARLNARLVTQTDAEYPERLRQIHDPPPFLYTRGSFVSQDDLAIAIVGARTASTYGRKMARELAHELAGCGVCVVSGLARGIDSEAHQAALEAGGRTIAVLGSGLDVVYPREHIALAERIAESGAVVSEFSFGSQPEAGNFPYRNRVISGISLGTVVVEATEKSGSLITAQCALDQNREVFAVPGPVTASRSRGPHRLIKDGAKLVESIDDILSEIAPALARTDRVEKNETSAPVVLLEPDEERVFQLFPEEAVHVDTLITGSGLEPARVLEVLLGLELKGIVTQLPGMYFTATRGSQRGGR